MDPTVESADQPGAEDAGAIAARLWVRVAGLLHPATTDAERLDILLELLSAVENGAGAEVAEDSTAAVVAAARESPPGDPDHVARYAVALLERLRRLTPLTELLQNATLAPALRLRAARALLRTGGEEGAPAVERSAAEERTRDAGDRDLADRLDASLAAFRSAPPLPAAGGAHRFPGACPACFGDLLHLCGIDLPGQFAEVRRLSLWLCRSCGAGVSGDSDRIPRPLFETVHAGEMAVLITLYDDCPRPTDPGCSCRSHQEFGVGSPAPEPK